MTILATFQLTDLVTGQLQGFEKVQLSSPQFLSVKPRRVLASALPVSGMQTASGVVGRCGFSRWSRCQPVLLDVDGNPHGIEVVSHSL